ncbi:MAG: FAD-binding oxidoreductase [Bacteroidota bacterium]
MKDFIIVGQGLAAYVLAHSFKKHNITFTIVGDQNLSSCSRIAAGIWNPVVFKRATKSWLADALIAELTVFYSDCSKTFGKKIITHRPIIKPFTEDQEKHLWLKKSKSDLAGFIDGTTYQDSPRDLAHCNIKNGYGLVQRSGNVDVAAFLDQSGIYFKEDLVCENFDHSRLQIFPDKVSYSNIEARQIVFCEGHLVKNNPFFRWIPLKPAKGEIMTLRVPELNFSDSIFNKNGFLMDVSEGTYRAGATYEWQDLSEVPTQKGLAELTAKVGEMIDCNFEIIKHEAGIRPSSLDRRPIVGRHPRHGNLFVFNGLGTKGVMLAPYFAKNFVNFYLQKEVLHPDIDLSRFYHLYEA